MATTSGIQVFSSSRWRSFASGRKYRIVTGNAICLGSWRDGQPAQPYPDVRPEPTLLTVLEDEQAIFVMSVFRRSVYEGIGGFDEALCTNEDYDYWIRAAAAGFVFARNDQPLGRYRRRNDSLSASDVRMLSGILKVFAKNRPLFGGRPAELAMLDRQVHRFEVALLGAAGARRDRTIGFRDRRHEPRRAARSPSGCAAGDGPADGALEPGAAVVRLRVPSDATRARSPSPS